MEEGEREERRRTKRDGGKRGQRDKTRETLRQLEGTGRRVNTADGKKQNTCWESFKTKEVTRGKIKRQYEE